MKRTTRWLLIAAGPVMVVAVGLTLASCSTPKNSAANGSSTVHANATPPKPSAMAGGADLWAQNCVHCHNVRSPSSYSDAQWEVVMLHMRVRANLTAEEHRRILAFLKSAH